MFSSYTDTRAAHVSDRKKYLDTLRDRAVSTASSVHEERHAYADSFRMEYASVPVSWRMEYASRFPEHVPSVPEHIPESLVHSSRSGVAPVPRPASPVRPESSERDDGSAIELVALRTEARIAEIVRDLNEKLERINDALRF
eukprot:m51a1_g7173 hypothetical protein (142) ;mRNA; f:68610-69251